jgi:hypothetical protein
MARFTHEEAVMAEKRELVEQSAEERLHRADELAREAAGYWQTTLRGLFALPNATVLSFTSAVFYLTGIAEQSYKRIESIGGRIGDEISRELKEFPRAAALPESERVKRQPSA